MPAATPYVSKLTPDQVQKLTSLLQSRSWEFFPCDYAHWRAKTDGIQVTAFTSGKLVVQGKKMEEFILYTLEPEILHEARYGYESELVKQENPQMFQPHAGIDESGKGDFFGPLVVACAYTDENTAQILLKAGVADSKTIGTDKKILELDELIRKTVPFALIIVGPEAYNRMYASFNNLNRLLAWGHAKALEELLEKVPTCPRAISDQFAKTEWTVKSALQTRGRQIILEQHPRAEADVAVAAASILARAEFVRRLKALGDSVECVLPKGAGPLVDQTAMTLAQSKGKDVFPKIAKLHFKTMLKL